MWMGREDPLDVAHLVVHMPRGGALGAWLGGPNALSGEEDMLRWVEHAVWASQSSKPKKIKPRAYPEGVHQREERMRRLQRQARRFKKRRQR